MSDYTKATNFATKDTLSTGNPNKIIKGTEIDTEFNAISSAVASKSDINSPTFTGVPAAPTASVGTNTTQIATTAFVIANATASPIPSGSVMLFYQANAPTGWTKVTTQNDKALRVVSGTGGGTGGTTAFSTVFANQTVSTSISISGTSGATTLSTSQIPSHTHTWGPQITVGAEGGNSGVANSTTSNSPVDGTTGATGGGGSHTHSFSGSGSGTSSAVTLNVQYIDIILCSKN
jgi:hypothetical protein